MKTLRARRTTLDPAKETKARVYRDLEIAMEERALAIHPAKKEIDRNEITNWTEAEADELEG